MILYFDLYSSICMLTFLSKFITAEIMVAVFISGVKWTPHDGRYEVVVDVARQNGRWLWGWVKHTNSTVSFHISYSSSTLHPPLHTPHSKHRLHSSHSNFTLRTPSPILGFQTQRPMPNKFMPTIFSPTIFSLLHDWGNFHDIANSISANSAGRCQMYCTLWTDMVTQTII